MSARRRARVLALSALYKLDLLGSSLDDVIAEVREGVCDQPESLYYLEKSGQAEALDFFEELVRGVWDTHGDLDSQLEDQLENWTWDRLGRVERAILRLGCYELLHREDIPSKVSLNEMVELSKSFCDAKSKDFVNGVLDSIARQAQS